MPKEYEIQISLSSDLTWSGALIATHPTTMQRYVLLGHWPRPGQVASRVVPEDTRMSDIPAIVGEMRNEILNRPRVFT